MSFLEKKGLTSAEIDEAFKRAPEAMAGAYSASQHLYPLPANPVVTRDGETYCAYSPALTVGNQHRSSSSASCRDYLCT